MEQARQLIILIGPPMTGKSTIALRLKTLLDIDHISLDYACARFYTEHTLYRLCARESIRNNCLVEHTIAKTFEEIAHRIPANYSAYIERLHAYSVFRVLNERKRGIIDFGAGHSHYSDGDLHQTVSFWVRRFQNTFALWPSADIEESASIIHERFLRTQNADNHSLVQPVPTIEQLCAWLRSARLNAYTSNIVYTGRRSVIELCDEIIGSLQNMKEL